MRNHFPCGHWHKGPSKTRSNGILVGYAPLYLDGDTDAENGIGLALYDTSTDTWTMGGLSLGGFPLLTEPNTLRVCNDFAAYYGMWDYVYGGDSSLRIHIFKDGVATTHDFWKQTIDAVYYLHTLDAMDISSSGVIACIVYVTSVGGEAKNTWAVFVSEDQGTTWKSPYYFADVGTNIYCSKIRIDASGNIWILICGSAHEFHLFKSSDNGDSWSLVCTQELTGTKNATQLGYTISNDGRYQFARILEDPADKFYYSSSYGATWDVSDTVAAYRYLFAANGSDLIIPYYNPDGSGIFKLSSDMGASYTDSTPPVLLTHYNENIQGDGLNIAYADDGNFTSLGVLLSLDGGVTWENKAIPTTGDFNCPVFTYGEGYAAAVDIFAGS